MRPKAMPISGPMNPGMGWLDWMLGRMLCVLGKHTWFNMRTERFGEDCVAQVHRCYYCDRERWIVPAGG